MSVGDSNIRHDASSDEGELTDESGPDRHHRNAQNPGKSSRSSSPASERHARGSTKSKEEEDRLRRNLLAKHSSKPAFMHSSEDEEQEMFTMQPGDSNTSRLGSRLEKADKNKFERDRKDRERNREKDRDRHDRHHKHKHDRRERERNERDRHSERERHDRDGRGERERHDDRENRDRHRSSKTDDRRNPKVISSSHDRTDRHKSERKDSERDRKERDDRSKDRDRSRKHRRSPTGSSSPESDRKREKKDLSERKDRKSEELFKPKQEKINDEKTDAREISEESAEDKTPASKSELTAADQLLADFDEDEPEIIEKNEKEITSFVLDSPVGPKKYSKFDSSPEPDDIASPEPSDEEMQYSDAEEEEEEPKIDFDPETAKFEELTEEQIAMLSPDSKQKMEDDYQQRLISDLPVFYPGIMGCRNVQEFECVNRVEEGTYGVVFRARDKRTDEIVALKRLKMEKEREGFPITSLREVNMLLKAGSHENIVNIKEILIGSSMDKIYVAMEFVEHDMKSLMDTMSKRGKRFTIGEQKTLLRQLLAGLAHMHHLWILHRDLKSSNLLLSHKGILKIADFGLAREFGSPLKPYTQIVVTLWYRSPELLLGKRLYSTPVDMWSVGCLMAEFQLLKPLFPGKGEIDQLELIFRQLGTPTTSVWPEYEELPLVKKVSLFKFPSNQLRKKFPASAMNETGFKLLNEFLRYDPEKRISAEEALSHPWFNEDPKPTPTEMFPTFPAKSEQHKAPPNAKKKQVPLVDINPETAKLLAEFKVRPEQIKSTGFSLKFDKAKF